MIVKAKLRPLEEQINQMRADLDLLHATVNEQNSAIEKLVNSAISNDLIMAQQTNSSNKRRIEMLEISQENQKNALRKVTDVSFNKSLSALDEAKKEICQSLTLIETTSSSNRTRIETLEVNHEMLAQTVSGCDHTRPKESSRLGKAANNKHSEKGHSPVRSAKTTGNEEPIQKETSLSWAGVVEHGGDAKFTTIDKKNQKNHRETDSQTKNPSKPKNGNNSAPQGRANLSSLVSDEAAKRMNSTNLKRESYRQYTVLLIHDGSFDNFDPKRFNSQFNVHCFKVDSYDALGDKNKKCVLGSRRTLDFHPLLCI